MTNAAQLAQVAMKTLVDEVVKNTSGTPGDPLVRAEVETVVNETIRQLRENPEGRTALLAHGLPTSNQSIG